MTWRMRMFKWFSLGFTALMVGGVVETASAVSGKVTAGDATVRLSTRQVWMKISKFDGGQACSGSGMRCHTGTDLAAGHRPNWWWVDAYVYLDCGTSECTGNESFTPGAMWTLVGRSYGSQYNDSWKYHLVANEANDPDAEMNTIIHDWINGAPEPIFYMGQYSTDHTVFTGQACGIEDVPAFYQSGVGVYVWHANITTACNSPPSAADAPFSKSYLRAISGTPSPECKPECEYVSEKPTLQSTWGTVKSLWRE